MKKIKRPQSKVNYNCIMFEGLFNSLGTDILGLTTIVPLFLREYGASLTAVGALPTLQQAMTAFIPLLTGGLVAGTRSKRRLSLCLNGISRTAILIIPIVILSGMNNSMAVAVFFGVMTVFFMFQAVTSISFSYLLGVCVEARQRGRLMGSLFAYSGIFAFFSSNIIRILRESESLTPPQRYAAIFGLGGAMMALSVMFFLPLKESNLEDYKKEKLNIANYISKLSACLKNGNFRTMLYAQIFSQACIIVNTFIFVVADETLSLPTEAVSYMIIVQTAGTVAGGLIGGRMSEKVGTKRSIMLAQFLGPLIPAMELTAIFLPIREETMPAKVCLMLAATFLIGFSKSAFTAYQSYLLEIAEESNSIYYIVMKSLALLPVSFLSILVGAYMDQYSIEPVLILQIVIAILAVFGSTKLKLFLYRKTNG